MTQTIRSLSDARVARCLDGGVMLLAERGVDVDGYRPVADRHEGGRWLTLWKLPTVAELCAEHEAEKVAAAERAQRQAEGYRGVAGLGFLDGFAVRS